MMVRVLDSEWSQLREDVGFIKGTVSALVTEPPIPERLAAVETMLRAENESFQRRWRVYGVIVASLASAATVISVFVAVHSSLIGG